MEWQWSLWLGKDRGNRIVNLEDRKRGRRLDIGHSCDPPWRNSRFHEGSTNLSLIFFLQFKIFNQRIKYYVFLRRGWHMAAG